MWPCNFSFRSEVALQGTAAHPAAGRPALRLRSRSEAVAARFPSASSRFGTKSRRALRPSGPSGPRGGRRAEAATGGGRRRQGAKTRLKPVHTPRALAPGNLRSSRTLAGPRRACGDPRASGNGARGIGLCPVAGRTDPNKLGSGPTPQSKGRETFLLSFFLFQGKIKERKSYALAIALSSKLGSFPVC